MLVGDVYRETVGAKNTISTIGVSAAAVGLALGVTIAASPTELAVFCRFSGANCQFRAYVCQSLVTKTL